MLTITATADKVDEIPEALRSTAKEENGKFTVQTLPDGWGLDNVAASAQLRSKLTKAEQDAKRAAERMKVFAKDDKGTIYEPDEFTALLNEHKALKEAQGKAPNIEELRKQIAADYDGRYSKKLTEAEKRAQDLDRELDNTTLDAVINQLVAEMRPKDGKAEIARLLLQQKLGIDRADGKRVVRVRTPDGKDWQASASAVDGFLPPKDFALNVLRTQHADMFQGDGASGAGASSASGNGRRNKYTFARSRMKEHMDEYYAMEKQAKADGGQTVVIDQNA
ncbi:MAG: hypothetical protein WAT39_23975 [Planctomycetota bacterium]